MDTKVLVAATLSTALLALAPSQAHAAEPDAPVVTRADVDKPATPKDGVGMIVGGALSLGFAGGLTALEINNAALGGDWVGGTILAGEGVLISPCVVGLSEITIAVTTDPYVSQPNAFSNGTTEIVNRTSVEVKEESTELKKVSGGATVADLLTNLKALGMKPSQLVSVFVALDKHGFLHADLEVR